MFTAYGADHRRLRKLVAPAFTARRTDAMLPARGGASPRPCWTTWPRTPRASRWTCAPRFNHPLPMQVICELFGFPEGEQRAELARLVDGHHGHHGRPRSRPAPPPRPSMRCCPSLVAAKRENPADDLTSLLVSARDDEGERLTEQELLDTLLLVIGAGHETTVNLLGNAVHALLTHPEQLQLRAVGRGPVERRHRGDAALGAQHRRPPAALRRRGHRPPGRHRPSARARRSSRRTPRPAATPTFHGETAADFDVRRARQEHLAFGHGVHHCLGAPLARMEARIALPALFARFPDLQLAVPSGELEPTGGFISGGLRSLPVRLTSG